MHHPSRGSLVAVVLTAVLALAPSSAFAPGAAGSGHVRADAQVIAAAVDAFDEQDGEPVNVVTLAGGRESRL